MKQYKAISNTKKCVWFVSLDDDQAKQWLIQHFPNDQFEFKEIKTKVTGYKKTLTFFDEYNTIK